jgi:hypothetical protein
MLEISEDVVLEDIVLEDVIFEDVTCMVVIAQRILNY